VERGGCSPWSRVCGIGRRWRRGSGGHRLVVAEATGSGGHLVLCADAAPWHGGCQQPRRQSGRSGAQSGDRRRRGIWCWSGAERRVGSLGRRLRECERVSVVCFVGLRWSVSCELVDFTRCDACMLDTTSEVVDHKVSIDILHMGAKGSGHISVHS
jgi:hypothetical protein